MTEDKRKFLRFECLIPIDLLEIGDSGASAEEAFLDNVSRDGLRVVFDLGHAFQKGEDVNIQIRKPVEQQACQITGEVIWSKPVGKKLEVGLKIKKMEKCTKSELLDMGYDAWRRKHKAKESTEEVRSVPKRKKS
jgi:Tfp pilus assembly protein PilZ